MRGSAITATVEPTGGGTAARLDSIDLLRGVIMILISLDHVRDYFTSLRFPAEDITQPGSCCSSRAG
jgi:uncharacterized membrane protein